MDKFLKLFSKNTKNTSKSETNENKIKDIENSAKTEVKENLDSIKSDKPLQNEILYLNKFSSEDSKKQEGFYYKKYIDQITKLKLVIQNKIV